MFADNQETYLINLRNKLWGDIFAFLSALLTSEKETINEEIVSSILLNGNNEQFIKTVCINIDGKISQLQKSALKFIISLLTPQNCTKAEKSDKGTSVETLFVKSKSNLDEIENVDPKKISSREKYCTSDHFYSEETSENIKNGRSNHQNLLDKYDADSNLTFGVLLCQSLLKLYEIQYLDSNKDVKKKELVIGALSCLFWASDNAKIFALEVKWLEKVMENLKSLNLELSLHSLEALRMSEKKKVSIFNILYNTNDRQKIWMRLHISSARFHDYGKL